MTSIASWKIDRLKERAAACAAGVVGRKFRVKMSKTGFLEGTIVSCVVAGLRQRGLSEIVQFKVEILAENGAVGSAVVESLPRW